MEQDIKDLKILVKYLIAKGSKRFSEEDLLNVQQALARSECSSTNGIKDITNLIQKQ